MNVKLEISKYYQLNVTVLEARQLQVINSDTIAIISVGKEKKRIAAKSSKTENPYFNELHSFSFHEPLQTLLPRRLKLAVNQTKCNRIIGTCDVELTSVWQQPGHQFYHKWASLTHPDDPLLGLRGYLKCDIILLEEGLPPPVPAPLPDEGNDISSNLLVPIGIPYRRQKALFNITIYRADGIRYHRGKFSREHEVKCKSLYMQVHFGVKTVKTRVVKNTVEPVWNQALTFIEPIPSLFQTILFELWDKKYGLIGKTTIEFGKLCSHTDILAMPTFGPAFIYVYQQQKKNISATRLSGRVLISLNCDLIDRGNPVIKLKNPVVIPLDEKFFGRYEIYTLFLALYQITFFKKEFTLNSKIHLSHGANYTAHGIQFESDRNTLNSNLIDKSLISMADCSKICKQYYGWRSDSKIPCAQISGSWPGTDYREKRKNFIKNTMAVLSKQVHELGHNQQHGAFTSVKNLFQNMLNACQNILSYRPYFFETKLDTIRRTEIVELLRQVQANIEIYISKENWAVEEVTSTLQNYISDILELADDQQRTFPDFEITLKNGNQKKTTWVIMNTEDYLHSNDEKECGKYCGKVQTMFVQDSKGCEVTAMDAFIWFGHRRDLTLDSIKRMIGTVTNNENTNTPEVFLEGVHLFELRCHIYQGRLNPGLDESGLADPFVRLIAFGQCQETQVRAQRLDPIWDETLIFPAVKIYGDSKLIKLQSVGVIIEVLDYDDDGVELVGRVSARPAVTLLGEAYIPERLTTITLTRHQEETGEIVIALELIEIKDAANSSHNSSKTFSIPDEIRPHLKLYHLEVIFWGIRDYKVKSCWPASHMMAIVECNRMRLESTLAKEEATFNFECKQQRAEIYIPEEIEYAPPLSLGLYEFNSFNRASYKGGSMIPHVFKFIRHPIAKKSLTHAKSGLNFTTRVDIPTNNTSEPSTANLDETPDWWTKYYATRRLGGNSRRITLYKQELECRPEFEGFQDYISTFAMKRGKTNTKNELAKQETIGYMKCSIKICPDPHNAINEIPFKTDPLNITVRIYIVAAHNLTPTDINGGCDPYITVQLGNSKISDRKNYIYKDTDPIFGKCFELRGTLPMDHTLTVRVLDHDCCKADDLIGETLIDIENRVFTKHRASCGISDTFETNGGHCQWRDLEKPTEILQRICQENQLPPPEFHENSAIIDIYSIPRDPFEDKQVHALRILRNFQMIPDVGFALVPEHVETRFLYHPKKPKIDQGQLEMWVDIFGGHDGVPPAVNITPRPPEKLHLRVIIWSTAEVLRSDFNILTGEESVDIYVQGWLTSYKDSQLTDIHYRSKTGDGVFNWRFIFPFMYSPSDHNMIIYKKANMIGSMKKDRVPPKLELQVWDNDTLSMDDYIGSLTLDLTNMPKGAQSAKKCTIQMMQSTYPTINLFKLRKIRGWWPFRAKGSEEEDIIGGKVDMELEILSESESNLRPAGLGREGPQALPEPKRPETFMFWGINPFTMLKTIAFGQIGRKLMLLAVIGVFAIFILSAWLEFPRLLLKMWLKVDQ